MTGEIGLLLIGMGIGWIAGIIFEAWGQSRERRRHPQAADRPSE